MAPVVMAMAVTPLVPGVRSDSPVAESAPVQAEPEVKLAAANVKAKKDIKRLVGEEDEESEGDSEASMSDAEMLAEVELAEAGMQAGAPAPEPYPPATCPGAVAAPVILDSGGGFGISPLLLVGLGLAAAAGAALLLGGDDEDENEAPIAQPDTATVAEDATVSGSVATNDSDPDGDTLTYTLNGSVPGLTLNSNGSYTFDASGAAFQALGVGETQTVVANYTVSDGELTATSTLTITVTGVNDAPVAADDTAAATEGAAAVTGSVATNDVDPDGDPLTFALQAPVAGLTLNANGTYSFDPNDPAYAGLAEGEVQTVVATYVVTDSAGATDTATLTITVTGVNDPPVITSGAAATVAENAATSTVVYDAEATDPDGDTVTFSLTGEDAALFTIDPVTGEVRLIASADFEADASYNITVVATDENGATDTQDVVVTVTDVNEAPVLQAAAAAVDEDAVVTGAVTGTDPEGGPLTFTLAEPVAGLTLNADGTFTLDATDPAYQGLAEGEVQTIVATVIATDEDGLSSTTTLTLTVTGVNDAPVITSAAVGTVAENASPLTVVLDADATDPDGDTVTFSLEGADAALFTIDAVTGEIRLIASADFETRTSFDLTVVATDENGAEDRQDVVINVTDVNEAPVLQAVAVAVEEDAVVTGEVTGTDPEGGPLTFTLAEPVAGLTLNADGTFTLDASDPAYQGLAEGEIQTVVATVIATDEDGLTSETTITITVTGTADAPVITSAATADIVENADPSTVVLDVDATDPDGDAVTFSLAGADAAFFTIDPVTGELRLVASADFETRTTYNLTVIATDSTGLVDTQDITVNVTDQFAIQSLDVDDDANLATAFTIDAGLNEFRFTDDDDIANNVIVDNFGPEDVIVFDADFSAVAFANLGDTDGNGLADLQITINNGGVLTEIVLTDVITDVDALVFDEATAELAVYAGVDNFQTAAAPPPPPADPTAASLDVDNDSNSATEFTIDAGSADFAFTDDSTIENNVRLINFDEGDTITTNADAGTAAFANLGDTDGDGLGDLQITVNDGGVISEIIIENAVSASALIFDEASAEASVGFDFFSYA